jgi:hypothetical protein
LIGHFHFLNLQYASEISRRIGSFDEDSGQVLLSEFQVSEKDLMSYSRSIMQVSWLEFNVFTLNGFQQAVEKATTELQVPLYNLSNGIHVILASSIEKCRCALLRCEFPRAFFVLCDGHY